MKVNEAAISYPLVHYEISSCSITSNYFQAVNSIPVYFDREVGTKALKIQLLFSGKTRQEVESKISDFVALVSGECTIRLFDTDTYFYDCIFNQVDEIKLDSIYNQLVTISFIATKKGDRQTITLNKTATQTVNVLGNLPSLCRYEVTALTTVSNVKVNDITISSIAANKTVVIDGITKLVTQDGSNVFPSVDMIDFPKLQPGNNTIILSDTTISVVVKYYPLFI